MAYLFVFAALANVGPVHDILYVFEYDYITPKAPEGHARMRMTERQVDTHVLTRVPGTRVRVRVWTMSGYECEFLRAWASLVFRQWRPTAILTHTQYCNTRDVCCTWYLSRSVRSRCAVVCAQLPHPYASPLRSDQASSNAGRLYLRFARAIEA